ncbi:MAG TPA: hypothetical protein VHR45_10095, partial [Thermoanaerobaculia bacterium]|nr:hypothetical protein [Thermoanaerobaculia bacterium]
MMRWRVATLFVALLEAALAASAQSWQQWGQNPRHTGSVATVGQRAQRVLADVIYDPFTAQEAANPPAPPDLRVHYQTPLVVGDDVFMEFKTGTYTGITTW